MDTKVLGRVWAAAPVTPNIDPGAAKYNLGWVAEIPVYQMLNFINNRHDTNTLSLAERGMFQWGNDVTYKMGGLVWNEVDSFIYVALVDNPSKTLTPNNNPSQWTKSSIQITRDQYDTEVAKWNDHITNMNNPHALTCAILNTYTRAEIDQKVGIVQGDVDAHEANLNNPHAVTAVQVGAVPVTGGTYTGQVDHTAVKTGFGNSPSTQFITSDANGMYLQKGVAKLGLNASNVGVFVNDLGVESNILSEQDYVLLRATEEPSFVAPIFDFAADLRNSIAIRYGVGVSTFTGPAGRGYINKSGKGATAGLNEPRLTKSGLHMNSGEGESLIFPTLNNLSGFQSFSVSLDMQVPKSATSMWIVNWPSGAVLNGFVKEADNSITYKYSEGGVQKSLLILTNAEWTDTSYMKLCVTYDGASLRTFVNGTLKISTAAILNLTTDGNINMCQAGTGVGAAYYNLFKIWAKALTDRQASNA